MEGWKVEVKWWHIAIAIIIAGAISGFIGYHIGRSSYESNTRVEADTLYIYDTTIIRQPEYITKYVVKDNPVPILPGAIIRDTMVIHDTIWLQREVKVYEDELYRAVVSGVAPSLDEISIYQREKVIYRDVYKTIKEKPRRWGVSVQGGMGVMYDIVHNNAAAGPYIGIGVHYKIL